MNRNDLPVLVTLIAGSVVLLEFFVKSKALQDWSREFLNWGVIIYAFATALGAANLLRIHFARAQQRKEDWWYSWVVIGLLIGYFLLGVVKKSSSLEYRFIWDNLLQPLSATVFSTNAFFMTSAAFRAFRVRSVDASILLVSSVLVMLGRVPIGSVVWSGFPGVAQWIMRVPNTAGMRGIVIGASLGAITISLRILLGIERSHFGGLGE